MNDSMEKSLLAMLLAIRELDNPLNSKEKDKLSIIAEQLSLTPAAWNTHIEANLMEIIDRNSSLNIIFQGIKSQIENIPEIPQNLIPSTEELAQVIPTKVKPSIRPIPKFDDSNKDIPGITNISIQVFLSPEPSQTVQKNKKFEKLLNFIRRGGRK
ncbi:MAG: hypothetical protein MGG11_13630 [Trichodesmium sp. MAG_R03]|nr:hypothetical protein [Trichodesmium sp. MAG_R03]